jgi:hypothetical protein
MRGAFCERSGNRFENHLEVAAARVWNTDGVMHPLALTVASTP